MLWYSLEEPTAALLMGTHNTVFMEKSENYSYFLAEKSTLSDAMYQLDLKSIDLRPFFTTYRIWPNYYTYPYKRTVKQIHSLKITASVLFCLLFYKGICCGYPFELHRLVDAI